ncbi:5' exonuclease Apollo-like [Macrosteles quadrilineatus]|uniref:5' exonuclease Apollo-like n=1 Tax=Macrosteles quadrilineatus TaxID=74068 RepID=UPI0023E23187|nr:5' exonuclease Apollo-like [Macrosteles quadrilineatus]XP_054273392.1 5' exonuclease Apollo-like [Macrosteles quadrilineatus]XP_054273393.1 5' exonuclease Apollo-like [Macrosteles quadrilineatus]XP_054273394.1 5' exonuclease Apollo-like [Macrosteles quadrilineatus]XP_054273395.1 5' exonuclease Apollo-like [Macrosteles quadrilineatus]XP_054273396.1 5' exonuclease Apollo-like [Macrosteles quadrilineatus]XP_054273397.1 5' exonuclease Apollo-like [Macrosteles quadrilineatus]
MYGKVIGKSISVDCFEEVTKNGIYFLTSGHLNSPLPPHVDRVYTSTHNAWLLQTKCKVDAGKIVSMPVNQRFLIQDKIKNLDFYVTLLDAKQKPGAVMFLFEGKEIGNILYAGKCCYSDTFFGKPLINFLKVKLVDYLYVHAPYEDRQSHSKTVSEAVDDIVNTIRWNSNCKIIISEPFFREDILTSLKFRLRKPISVSEPIMRHLEELGKGSDFQLDQSTAQVLVTHKSIGKVTRFKQPVFKIVIVPCPMNLSKEEVEFKVSRLEARGYYVIFYRNHCSQQELVTLTRCINAKHTVLIRPTPLFMHPAEQPMNVTYWTRHGSICQILDFLDSFDRQKTKKSPHNEVNILERSCVATDVKAREAKPPEAFILIESDLESNASRDERVTSQKA